MLQQRDCKSALLCFKQLSLARGVGGEAALEQIVTLAEDALHAGRAAVLSAAQQNCLDAFLEHSLVDDMLLRLGLGKL